MKVLAFDCFGTVFDLSGVAHEEVRAYAKHIHQPEWSPLKLPQAWESLPAHPDALEALERLREQYMVVTCSNGPLGLLAKLSKANGISWDAIIPLELNKVFKPNPKAYLTVCEVLGVEPSQVTMVTANRTFGDLEAARALGMQAFLINRAREPLAASCPTNLTDLAALLCGPLPDDVWVSPEAKL